MLSVPPTDHGFQHFIAGITLLDIEFGVARSRICGAKRKPSKAGLLLF
jgi:hypothetical protein